MKSFVAVFKKYGIFVILILTFVTFSLLHPAFLTKTNLLNIARQVSMVGIASVGYVCIMMMGCMDLSLSSQVALINIIGSILMAKLGWGMWPSILVMMLTSCFCGLVNALIITKIKMPPLICTLAMMTLLSGVAYLLCKGLPIFGLPKSFTKIGQGYLIGIPIPVIIMAILFLIGSFILNRTYLGRNFYAIGGNEEACQLSGINTDLMKIIAYQISSVCVGIASIVLLSRSNSGQPAAGKDMTFDVMTAVILGGGSIAGGTGKMSTTVAGVFVIGMLNNGLVLLNISTYTQDVLKGAVLLLAVGFDCLQNIAAKQKKISVAEIAASNAEKAK